MEGARFALGSTAGLAGRMSAHLSIMKTFGEVRSLQTKVDYVIECV
jgi:hypothetical protein